MIFTCEKDHVMSRKFTSCALLLASWMLLTLPAIAEERVKIRSNEELLQKAGEDPFNWPKVALYLYAYIQRKPEQMNTPSHAVEIISRLKDAVNKVDMGIPAGTTGGPPMAEWRPQLWSALADPPPPGHSCSGSSKETCKKYGATCEVDKGIDGEMSDLCRWQRILVPCQFKRAGGIWTTASSKFALRHPDVVKP